MKLTELMHAHDYLAVQREAQRILQIMMGNMDVRPMPDGAVKLVVTGDVELLDRLAVWGCRIEDAEGVLTDSEDGADTEANDCGAPVAQADIPAVQIFDLPIGPLPLILRAA